MNNLEYNQSYHDAYLKIYGDYTDNKNNNNQKKFNYNNYYKFNFRKIIITFLFILIPVLFTFTIEFSTNYEKQYISKNSLIDHEKYIIQNNDEKNVALKNYKDQILFGQKDKNIEIESEISEKKFVKKNLKDKKAMDINDIYFLSNLSEKKINFIKMILPIAIQQNQAILAERERLLKIKEYLESNKTIDKNENKFIRFLASKYKVKYKNKHKVDIIKELLAFVDVIPNSIVLAQAANESGWGSSRFAKKYNALFGEYTYNNELGIVPIKREEGKKHLIKHFASVDQSVISYFNNINSHYAYDEFRELRKVQRNKNVSFDVLSLVEKLDFYAEDVEYVNTISSIIKTNKLEKFDNIKSATNL